MCRTRVLRARFTPGKGAVSLKLFLETIVGGWITSLVQRVKAAPAPVIVDPAACSHYYIVHTAVAGKFYFYSFLVAVLFNCGGSSRLRTFLRRYMLYQNSATFIKGGRQPLKYVLFQRQLPLAASPWKGIFYLLSLDAYFRGRGSLHCGVVGLARFCID